jgi:hypothetical protein
MKKVLITLTLCLLCLSFNSFAGDGDLIVNGNVGVGTTSPLGKLHIRADAGGSRASQLFIDGAANPYQKLYIGINNNGGAQSGDYASIEYVSEYIHWGPLVLQADGGYVGIGITDTAGYTLYVNGPMISGGYYVGSDIRWKKNIEPITNAVSLIQGLQGVRFDWRSDEFKDKKFAEERQVGLIAQDIEQVIPEAVKTDKNGFKAVSYERLTAVLVEALKEQQKEIEGLRNDIKKLKGL